jgi:imidazolonepropionase-like amidohydrolase
MLYEQKSAAKAVKERKGRAMVQRHHEPATEKQPAVRKQSKPKDLAVAVPVAAAISGGGKAKKTGTVLARAQLPRATVGAVAGAVVADRQTTLLGKTTYREAEKVAREGAVGTMATDEMPRMRDAFTDKEREETRNKMRLWKKKENLHRKVRAHAHSLVTCMLHVLRSECTLHVSLTRRRLSKCTHCLDTRRA